MLASVDDSRDLCSKAFRKMAHRALDFLGSSEPVVEASCAITESYFGRTGANSL